jgi:diguanylate cyclase (GGDEF)-like protein/PAS domain S-box-containing protein
MQSILLTPASISYLNQFLLSILITVYLGWRLNKQTSVARQDVLLFVFFIATSIFSLLFFLEVSLLPSERLYAVYLQYIVLGIMLIVLVQFAYHFPVLNEKQTLERRVLAVLLTIYTLWEAGFAIWRFYKLSHGVVLFRPDYTDIFPAIGFLCVIFVFARNAFQNWELRAARRFAFVFIVPFWLAVLNQVKTFYGVSTSIYHINMSVGILFTIFLFVLNYVTARPEKTTFTIKLSGAIITAMLALFGVVAWLVSPAYASRYAPNIWDHRTLHFAPNSQGGYDVAEIPFRYETDLGQNLGLTDNGYVKPHAEVKYDFQFFGDQYHNLYISNDGAISMGESLNLRDLQYHFSKAPVIFILLIDLQPESNLNGGVFLQRLEDQLIVTYKNVPGFSHPEDSYTFQSILYPDGSFDITYNGLPTQASFFVNDNPFASIWAVGAKPAGRLPTQFVNFNSGPLQTGPQGAVQDEYLNFRIFLDSFLQPLAIAVLASGSFFIFVLWSLFRHGFAQPLDSLLQGVQAFNNGQRNVYIPVQFNDEVGFLTESFNSLTHELNDAISNLEERVSNQTLSLRAANEQLTKLKIAIEQSPSSIAITNALAEIEYINPAFTQISGYTLEEVQGQNPRILQSGLTSAQTFSEMWENLVTGKPWRGELVNKRKNGEIYWEYTMIAPIFNAEGSITHYVAVKEDATERHKAQDALRESEEQYRQLFELESDAIFIIRNEDGLILKANSASTTLYGFSADELLSMRNTDLSAEPEQTQQATNTPFPLDQIVHIPLRWHRKKDGTTFPVEITARFIIWQGVSVHIAAIRDVTHREEIEQELKRIAVTDPLTGLFNRRHFIVQAQQYFEQSRGPSQNICLLMIDIDHFKMFNDKYGHEVGDIVLKSVAELLNLNVRPSDAFARYGGEEFTLLLPRTGEAEAMHIAERLRHKVENLEHIYMDEKLNITISIGISSIGEDVDSLDALLRYSDQALYIAKQSGRNRCVLWRGQQKSPTQLTNASG